MNDLQTWLKKGAAPNPLDELNRKFEEIEGFNALLDQQKQSRKVQTFIRSQLCSCRTFASGAKLIRCPSTNCKGKGVK